MPSAPAGAIATVQTVDSTSVNAAAGSTDARNSYIYGQTEPISDTNVGNREGEGVKAALTLSGSIPDNNMQMKTDFYSHDEAVHLTNTDGANALQIEVSVESKIDKTTSDSSSQFVSDDACRTSGTSQGKDAGSIRDVNILREESDSEFDTTTNNDCELGKSHGDGETCAVGPASFLVCDPTASIPENNFPLLAVHGKSGNDLEELDVTLHPNSASKMVSTSNIADSDYESTLNGSMSQSSKIHMIDALANIIADARNNKVSVVSVSFFSSI